VVHDEDQQVLVGTTAEELDSEEMIFGQVERPLD
jgi:hypothetical protein